MKRKTQLTVKVEKDVLKIEIGIETLGYALMSEDTTWQDNLIIKDFDGFAKDVARELRAEAEDGSTMVHRMLDEAGFQAVDNGSEAVEEGDLEAFLGEKWLIENNLKEF